MDDRIIQIQKLLDAADGNLSSARTMIRELTASDSSPLDLEGKLENVNPANEKVIEGVFDGEQMVAPDGQTYPIPPNYASKSRLVEGDTLKLTISDDGSFVFKQILPIDRRSAVGTLALTDGNYSISAEGKSYKVLTASVTFYKAEPGDQVTITLPKEHEAVWASLENVIKKMPEAEVSRHSEPSEESSAPDFGSFVSTQDDTKEVANTPVVIPEENVVPAPTDTVPTESQTTVENVEPVTDSSDAPKIEFPSGATNISDEQLLENLKNNLQSIDQPAYVAPESAPTAKPVDNIVANDMAQLTKEPAAPATEDKPIAELDI